MYRLRENSSECDEVGYRNPNKAVSAMVPETTLDKVGGFRREIV